MIADIDLGEMKEFKGISADFLNSPGSWIFLPSEVEFEFSSNGRSFETAGKVINDKRWDTFAGARKEFDLTKSFSAALVMVVKYPCIPYKLRVAAAVFAFFQVIFGLETNS